MTKIISTAINKGGVGKTTLIGNLVGILAEKYNKKILMIDIDGQGNLGISFKLVPESIENTVYDVLVDDFPIKDVIIPINDNVDILPANSDMSFIEFDILPNIHKYKNPFYLLDNALKPIKDDYDYIFIDTPPAMGLIVGNALIASTDIIIPYVPEVFAVNGLIRIHKAIQDFSSKYNTDLNVMGIVGMMVDTRTTLHQDMLQQARKHCYENNIHMFETVIPRSIRFASSNLEGVPAVWSKDKNHLVRTYHDLINELIEKGDINGS